MNNIGPICTCMNSQVRWRNKKYVFLLPHWWGSLFMIDTHPPTPPPPTHPPKKEKKKKKNSISKIMHSFVILNECSCRCKIDIHQRVSSYLPSKSISVTWTNDLPVQLRLNMLYWNISWQLNFYHMATIGTSEDIWSDVKPCQESPESCDKKMEELARLDDWSIRQ